MAVGCLLIASCVSWAHAADGVSGSTSVKGVRALLVGVSDYPSLDKGYQLSGPRNDVQRMQRILGQRGLSAAQMTVLADGVPGAGAPTRSNILAALNQLAHNVRTGETVFLYMAGHGSQQPADRRTPDGRGEADGLVEIFLPTDIGKWNGAKGEVENAITKFELRAVVDRMLAKGAFVWGVFDSCHSATLVRSAPASDVRYRHVSPLDLGVAQDSLDEARANGRQTRGGAASDDEGALDTLRKAPAPKNADAVFFYAAQTTEVTPEMRLPLDAPDRQPYGLFTFMLTRALELGRPMTYRQLAQYVLTQYGGLAEARATPMFSGTALDQYVFGQQTVPVRQWPANPDQLTIPDGSLSDLSPNALFALMPGPLAQLGEARGYAMASKVELTRTELMPMAYAGMAPPQKATYRPESYWRLVSNPQRYSLRVAVDDRQCRSGCPWGASIARLKSAPIEGAHIQWVTEAPDVVLQLRADQIILLPPGAQGELACASKKGCTDVPVRGTTLLRLGAQAPGESSSEASQSATLEQQHSQLKSMLQSVAKSTNLLRLATRLVSESEARGLSVRMEVSRSGRSGKEVIQASQVPRLHPGDKLSVQFKNEGQRPVDLTLLYADARFGIGALFPVGGEVNRLQPGDTQRVDGIQISDADGVYGIERLLVISVEAEAQAERADFSFLAQPPLQNAARTRGGSTSDAMQDFLEAAYAEAPTRSAARTLAKGTGMQVFTFNVQPARGVGRAP